jgi:MFS family permease
MLQADQAVSNERNHPRAKWMAVIAFINFNITIACIYGSFSVLLSAVQARLGVGPTNVSMGISVLSLTTALCAPVAGVLATKYSLRLVMLGGSLFSLAGYLLLALTANFPLFLIAFALFLGPGMAAGVVMPGTLVTRWFSANRGKALGFISTAIIIVVMPEIATWTLVHNGLPATYLMLAALSLVTVVSNFFVIDRPPSATAVVAEAAPGASAPAAGGFTMAQLIRSPRFWGLSLAFIASAVNSIVLTIHIVPMSHLWGIDAAHAAELLSVQSLAGIVGTNLFGWLADRIGAVMAMVLVAFDGGVFWLLLLMHPSFPEAVVIIGLIGVHGAGSVPAFSAALSEVFGRESFSRAYGLVQLIILPFSVLCVPAAALVYTRTGSYTGAIIGVAAFLLVSSMLALSVRRPRPPAPVLAE